MDAKDLEPGDVVIRQAHDPSVSLRQVGLVVDGGTEAGIDWKVMGGDEAIAQARQWIKTTLGRIFRVEGGKWSQVT